MSAANGRVRDDRIVTAEWRSSDNIVVPKWWALARRAAPYQDHSHQSIHGVLRRRAVCGSRLWRNGARGDPRSGKKASRDQMPVNPRFTVKHETPDNAKQRQQKQTTILCVFARPSVLGQRH